MRRRCRIGAAAAALFVVAVGRSGQALPVVINEVHYHPAAGSPLEFVEIHNPTDAVVDVGGWALADGARFVFPIGMMLGPGGFAVVARSRETLAGEFSLRASDLFGDLISGLDDDGERILLVDAAGNVIDAVEYEVRAPWDTAASGTGLALQRRCPEHDSDAPANWTARQPSPNRANNGVVCPPPLPVPRHLAISEIYYHPPQDFAEALEFVEIANVSAEPVNLRGYAFIDGVDFRFEDDRVLGPGEYLAVCRNEEAVRSALGATNTAGNLALSLSNAGERLTLVDPRGELVDSVRYRDDGDWPVAADGLGRSLEKVVLGAPSDDPASWVPSGEADLSAWNRAESSGIATSSKLIAYLLGPGEFLADNFALVDEADTSVNLLPNGSFDLGIDGWDPRGTHMETRWEPTGGVDGSGAMRIVSTGRGSGASQGVSIDILPELSREPDKRYRLTFDYRHAGGDPRLTVRLSGATASRGVWWQLGEGVSASPGAPNGAARRAVPPFVDRLARFPRAPRSADPVLITARVRGTGVARVSLRFAVNGGAASVVDMADDGLSDDGAARDGVWAIDLPPQAHASVVTFSIEAAAAAGGVRQFPARSDPYAAHVYYVSDDQPASSLPLYTVVLGLGTGRTARQLIDALNCSTYVDSLLAVGGDVFPGGIRRRGQSVCGDPAVTKRFLKVRFLRGRELSGLRKLNLQSLWTDKSLIREHLSWNLFDEIGNPYCEQSHLRLHVNGEYFGLYARLEHPDKRYLKRNHLNPQGNLYKAVASREERNGSTGSLTSSYEKKTNENGDFSDLRDFLSGMHDARSADLVAFFHRTTDEDKVIDYQAGQVLTNNRDYPHKNHYLYRDTAADKWFPTTWDMDLTFGKYWDGNFAGVLNDRMDNPGISPWYTTGVRDGGGGNFLLDKFFAQAGTWYRRAYLVRVWDAIAEKYTQESYDAKVSVLRDLLLIEQAEDIARWGRSRASTNDPRAPAEFEPNLQRVRDHIASRRAYLLNYLRNTEGFRGHDRLKITELLYNPPGGEDGEYIELWNNSGQEIDISGWTIEGLEEPRVDGTVDAFAFPQGTRAAADEVFVVAKSPEIFRLRHGDVARVFGPFPGNLSNRGEEVRVKDAGPGFPATVDFLDYGAVPPWPTAPDGLGYSLELTRVSADRDNDLAVAWRSSLLAGGTPGRIPRDGAEPIHFSRGDCDGDRRLTVVDAVTVLVYLFTGAAEPACLDACDHDGSRLLDLSDAVFFLGYLFGRGERMLPFPGPGACAPAEPGFCAASNCTPVN